MPLPAAAVGVTTAPVRHQVDSRWLMAYAASVDAFDDAYLDTRRDGGIVGHPLFPVCVEWPAVLAVRDALAGLGVASAEAARGVHLRHDLRSRRAVRPGDRLATTATVAGITTHRSGALVDLDLVTTDDRGLTVATTRMTTLYRGVDIDGDERPARALDAPEPGTAPAEADAVTVVRHDYGPGAAHVYTECSRIFNPIHTDARTAARAGLPGIILHGTATLAMALNHAVERLGAGADEVRRVQVHFGASVALPSTVAVRVVSDSSDGGVAWFDAVGGDGQPVLRRGVVAVGPAEVGVHG